MQLLTRFFLLLFFVPLVVSVRAAERLPNDSAAFSLEGRWDMTLMMGEKKAPSWLEVRHSGLHTLIGRYVGAGGSARPISRIVFRNNQLHFTLPPQWEQDTADLVFDGQVQGDSLSGTVIASNGARHTWTAVRAPSLRRTSAPTWDKPITLFNGKDLSGWRAMGENQWVVEGGVLRSPHSGANLITEKTFNDFKLHIEFRYEKGSNSGVYLRGRYEVQVADSKGKEPLIDEFGAVYGFLTPSEQAAREPGAWQSYDITLIGRMVTIVANGKQIICNQEIPGITGGAINSREGEPGPLYLQGDHGPVEFRNITITPAR